MPRACVRVACAFLYLCACVRSTHVAKEYVCQDPDTGTLHEINTTWRSTTFCGNYTCKLRRINTGQQPSKVFVSLFNQNPRGSNKANYTDEFTLTKILPELTKDNDRLLNKAEIDKITELLHSVKKSDLQAVIELYNVAQEMYKDMKVTDVKEDRANEAVSGESRDKIGLLMPSYWYEPANEHRKAADMRPEGSELDGATIYSASPYPYMQPQPYYYERSRTNYPNYLTGSLSNTEIRPGYPNVPNVPMSRPSLPPYYQQRNVYDGPAPSPGPTPQVPCNSCARPYQYQPLSVAANYPPRSPSNVYPYMLAYNYTNGYNNFYKGNPWAYYDYYRTNYPNQKSVYNMQRNPTVVEKSVDGNANANVNANVKDEKSWQTDPLSEGVINEIRANIAQRSKLINIPLKKRIKLERVSKVIKIDQNNRKTRSIPKVHSEEKHSRESEMSQKTIEELKSIENEEIMETYVERVTCAPNTELGYFKMGNLEKPYPECCPEKIEDKQR